MKGYAFSIEAEACPIPDPASQVFLNKQVNLCYKRIQKRSSA